MALRILLITGVLLAVTPATSGAWRTPWRWPVTGAVSALSPDDQGGVWTLVNKGRTLTADHVLADGQLRAHRARYSRSARLGSSPDGTPWIVDGTHRSLTRFNKYGVASSVRIPGRGAAFIPAVAGGYDTSLAAAPWFPLRERGRWSLATVSNGAISKIRLALPRYATRHTGLSQIAADASAAWVVFGRAVARVGVGTHAVTWYRLPNGVTGQAVTLMDGAAWVIGSDRRVIVQPAEGPPRTLAHRIPKARSYSVATALDRLWLITPTGQVDTFDADGEASHAGFKGSKLLTVDANGRTWLGGLNNVRMISRLDGCTVPALLGMEPAQALGSLVEGGCGYKQARLPAMGTGPERVVWASAGPADQLAGTVVSTETAAADGPCDFGSSWRKTVTSDDAVAGFASGLVETELWACVRATGDRVRIASMAADDDHGCGYCNSVSGYFGSLTLNGHWMAYATTYGDRYGSDTTLRVLNLATPTKVQTAELPYSDGAGPMALNADGDLAFLLGSPLTVQVLHSDGTQHAVGGARGTVTNLTIDDTTVTWSDAEGAHSAPIRSSP